MNGVKYMPSNNEQFLAWVNTFLATLQPLLEQLGFPPATYELLVALKNTFATALSATEAAATRTSTKIKARNAARKALEQTLRQAIREYLTYNHLLTDEQRDALGLPIHDGKPTPVPVPTTTIEAKVSLPAPATIDIHFHDAESEHRAKPMGVHGAEFRYAILDEPPVDWSQLSQSEFATRTPLQLVFSGYDRGKTLYFSGRWENSRGEKGPWNDIQSVIIP
jgi:hypothetical protein